MFRFVTCLTLAALLVLAVGCGPRGNTTDDRKGEGDPSAQEQGKKYLLTAEPAGARGVLETRKQARDGDDVVMVGHIAGSKKPFELFESGHGRVGSGVRERRVEAAERAVSRPVRRSRLVAGRGIGFIADAISTVNGSPVLAAPTCVRTWVSPAPVSRCFKSSAVNPSR